MIISEPVKAFPQDIELHSERLLLRPTRREDLDREDHWPDFDEPIYRHYNPPRDSVASKEYRWQQNLKRFDLKLAILAEGELVGYIGLFGTDFETGRSEMGIQFAANQRGMGYCKESLKRLCDEFFQVWGMGEMRLEVAIFNLPGVLCYERCGFQTVRIFWNQHAYQRHLDFENDPRLLPIKQHFRKTDEVVEVEYLYMTVQREAYLGLNMPSDGAK